MKVLSLFYMLAAAAAAIAAPATPDASGSATVSYDEVYDNAVGDLHTVACSDGPNGMLTKGKSAMH